MLFLLRQLLELFGVDARHTKGHWAKTELGRNVASYSPEASCWCLQGGIYFVSEKFSLTKDDRMQAAAALDAQAEKLGFENLVHFNDDPKTTPKQVRALIESAINS